MSDLDDLDDYITELGDAAWNKDPDAMDVIYTQLRALVVNTRDNRRSNEGPTDD